MHQPYGLSTTSADSCTHNLRSSLQVTGGTTTVLETVLKCDTERTELLEEEAKLLARVNTDPGAAIETRTQNGPSSDTVSSSRLEQASGSSRLTRSGLRDTW